MLQVGCSDCMEPGSRKAPASLGSPQPCCWAPPAVPPARSRLHPPGSELLLPRHSLPAEVRLCSKLELLDRVLVKLRAGGHKVRCCIDTSGPSTAVAVVSADCQRGCHCTALRCPHGGAATLS